ncbi:hypothetical protein PAEPH01_2666 [Pancytospora epiphaga]|nr:hypothetical protein PAEPH01_2666 [Pancytospora epiphaga]
MESSSVHSKIRSTLQKHKSTLVRMLRYQEYSKINTLLNRFTTSYMLDPTSYDMFRITPYTNEVAEKYGIDYVNASFIPLHGCTFIACQAPLATHEHVFKSLICKSKARYVVCLSSASRYFDKNIPESEEVIKKDGRVFITKTQYRIGERSVFIIKCHTWEDHSIIPNEDMRELLEHTKPGPEDRDVPVIVHCKAGVGRTGTYLAYKALSEMQEVTPSIFIDVLIELRAYRPYMVQSFSQLQFLAGNFLKI